MVVKVVARVVVSKVGFVLLVVYAVAGVMLCGC